jgi:uncharacterized protein YndB with AHSA1/START domain
MMDVPGEISASHRTVITGPGNPAEGHAVVLRRRYEVPVDDVWDACTSAERIARWFVPVTGKFKVGGSYQLDGNAGGEIVRCEPPRLLKVTWVFGDSPPAEVELRLEPDGEHTELELTHAGLTDAESWAQFGPGAAGVGWDLALLGLGQHLSGQPKNDSPPWLGTPQGREFVTRASTAWGAAFEAAGATPAEAAAAVRRTTAFYAPADSVTLHRSRMADLHSAANDAFSKRIVQRPTATATPAGRMSGSRP